jgi:uncharacterized membrane protein
MCVCVCMCVYVCMCMCNKQYTVDKIDDRYKNPVPNNVFFMYFYTIYLSFNTINLYSALDEIKRSYKTAEETDDSKDKVGRMWYVYVICGMWYVLCCMSMSYMYVVCLCRICMSYSMSYAVWRMWYALDPFVPPPITYNSIHTHTTTHTHTHIHT